jgi:hypothetical protein
MADAKPERSCPISLAGGHLVIRIQANNALQTGARFAIWDTLGRTALEQWTISAGVAGFSDHTVGTPTSQLDGAFLTWSIIVCSHDPQIGDGTVSVAVIQDGQPCASAPEASYPLQNIPFCADGRVIPITDELRFAAR